jgi:hypothetical protein
MTSSIVQSFQGPFQYDFNYLSGIIIQAVNGATRGLRRQKPGIEKVLNELQQNLSSQASILSVPTDMYTNITSITDKLTKVREARVLVSKLAEVLAETEAFLEDEREGEIGNVVIAVRRAAVRKNPAVVALFEETIRYHGQLALRAHKTRRKNKSVAEGNTSTSTSTGTSPVTTEGAGTRTGSGTATGSGGATGTSTTTGTGTGIGTGSGTGAGSGTGSGTGTGVTTTPVTPTAP